MDRYLLPSHKITTVGHWEAMADILGEPETEKLYGPRPELVNTSEAVSRLYIDDEAGGWIQGGPMWPVYVAAILAAVTLALVIIGGIRGQHEPASRVRVDIGTACAFTRGQAETCVE